MARPYRIVSALVTEPVPGADPASGWQIVKGMTGSTADGESVVLALTLWDERDYALRWEGGRWNLYARAPQGRRSPGESPEQGTRIASP